VVAYLAYVFGTNHPDEKIVCLLGVSRLHTDPGDAGTRFCSRPVWPMFDTF
jgi:hypothetical protein